jgi:hypothetical protein
MKPSGGDNSPPEAGCDISEDDAGSILPIVAIFCSKLTNQHECLDSNNVIRINTSWQTIKIYMDMPPYI